MTQKFDFDTHHIEFNGHRLQLPGHLIGLPGNPNGDSANWVMISVHHSSPSVTWLECLCRVSNTQVSGIIRADDCTDTIFQYVIEKWSTALPDNNGMRHFRFHFRSINPPL